MRDVVIKADPHAVADAVAQRFLSRVAVAQARGEIPNIALTGGSTARLVHRRIAELGPATGVDWSRVDFWWGDERFLPAGDPERNEVQARADFLDQVGASRIHPIPDSTSCGSAHEAANRYERALRDSASHHRIVFDVAMFGMGADGHVASLFPGFPQLDSDAGAAAVADSPKPPSERVTLTFPTLNSARAAWFLVTGADKAGAVQRAWSFGGSVSETPARGIKGPSVTWFVDEAAATSL